MSVTMVRYTTKPEHADENAALVEKVYAELNADRPDGLRYATFRLADGVSFVHLAIVEGANPLFDVAAFKEFTADIASRCVEPPVNVEATVVASFRLYEGD